MNIYLLDVFVALVGKESTEQVVEAAANDDIDMAVKRKGEKVIEGAVKLDENFIV